MDEQADVLQDLREGKLHLESNLATLAALVETLQTNNNELRLDVERYKAAAAAAADRPTTPPRERGGGDGSGSGASPMTFSSPSHHHPAVDRLEAKLLSAEQERNELRLLQASLAETLAHKHGRAEELAGEVGRLRGVCSHHLNDLESLQSSKVRPTVV